MDDGKDDAAKEATECGVELDRRCPDADDSTERWWLASAAAKGAKDAALTAR